MSLVLSKKFRDSPGTLDSHLDVEIADDHTVSDEMVFQRCVFNIFDERFPIYLVPIPLRGLKLIAGMDWLGHNGALIDCDR